jgi:peptidylprolyl isomerase
MKCCGSRLKVLLGVLVFIGAFGIGCLVAFYYGLPGRPTVVAAASGLKYVDLVEGQGATPQPGQRIVVHYRASLENGQEFENSYQRDTPVEFPIGVGGLIKGWEEGVMTMKVGGKRRLIIPPQLAYGAEGSPPKIPPGATLIFEVELLGVR